MKYLFFAPFECSFLSPIRLATVLDNYENIILQNHNATLVYCDGKKFNACMHNENSNKARCQLCNIYRKKLYSRLSGKINLMPISDFINQNIDYNIQYDFNSISELKNIEYKGVKIGYAALSTYLTLSRNLYPLIDNNFKNYINKLLRCCIVYSDLVQNAINQFNPDMITAFNSRTIDARPVIDICKNKKLNYISYEVAYNTFNQIRKISYINSTPHDVATNTKMIDLYWNSDFLPEKEKIAIAERFFYKRKNAINAGDKVYVKNQIKGKLPDEWNSQQHNILILNSSEDEFASLGEEYENKSLFQSQYEGIKYIFETFKNDPSFHFYLRIHPNLMKVNYLYHTKLYEFNNYSNNITIIPASSPISTYALIDAADKVIVFGSTTGPESVYWGKPTILLSYSLYSLLDICYSPQNLNELNNLISDTHLVLKDKKGALKYAYYRMNDEYEDYKHFKFTSRWYKLGPKLFQILIFNIDNSKWIKYTSMILQFFGKSFYYKKLSFPQKEDKNIFK